MVIVQETAILDHRVLEAKVVTHRMVVLLDTIIMVVTVEKEAGPQGVMAEDIVDRVIPVMEEPKTAAVPEAQRLVNVMPTRYPVAAAVVEAAMPNQAAKI